jgi:xylose isomerase
MEDWCRFSVCYWHTFRGLGADPFGGQTLFRTWDDGSNSVDNALRRVDAAFEFFTKLGAPFYTFHDVDVSPQGETLAQSNKNFDAVADYLQKKQTETGIKLLWGTANLFSHWRYAQGASTNPDAHVFAYAGAQVKKAMEVTHRLGGENYVFWGGREGYQSILNTNVRRELDHLARFLHMAVEHKKSLGATYQLLIEPKPREPTKHQVREREGERMAGPPPSFPNSPHSHLHPPPSFSSRSTTTTPRP